jgi:hypothetical protein
MESAVGVPEIAQFEVEKFSPAGSAEEMEQEAIDPPVLFTFKVEMVVFLVNINGLPV